MFFSLFILVNSETINTEVVDISRIASEIRGGKKFSEIVPLDEYRKSYPEAKEIFDIMETMDIQEEDCYSTAYRNLDYNCDKLTEEEKKTLSLRFTKCFFNITHRMKDFPYYYPEDEQTSNMNENTYAIFSAIKLHITNLCFSARRTKIYEETSGALLNLFKGVVDSMKSTQKYIESFNKNTQKILEKVQKIEEKQDENKHILSDLNSLMGNILDSIKGISSMLASSIKYLEKYKFFCVIFISALIIAYFLPEVLIPVILLTIVFLLVDIKLGRRNSWWDDSLPRSLMKTVYLTAVCTYPMYKAVLSINSFVKIISEAFTSNTNKKKIENPFRRLKMSPIIKRESFF